jgi:alkanesulfonate monooxygenase SsuD/methylene tetrahydromethanopterin reductase-like flavin-dependent oxidoreductase (luciferase family)
MTEQRQAFEGYVKSRGGSVMKRFGAYVESMTREWWDCWQSAQAALAQREPGADGEVAETIHLLHEFAEEDCEVTAQADFILGAACVLERTETARLAAEENYQAATLRANANAEMFKSMQLENDALRTELNETKETAVKLGSGLVDAMEEIGELRAELAALKQAK